MDYWEVSNIKKGDENREGMGGNMVKGVTKSNLEREKNCWMTSVAKTKFWMKTSKEICWKGKL